jgi:hypothetical protein
MDELDFEVDMLTYINMMQGMSYDEAVKAAIKEVREAHDDMYAHDYLIHP